MPVPIDQYTIQTPATLLQQTLTQRAAAKRQAMLDQIEGQYKTAQMQDMQSKAGLDQQRMGLEQQRMDMEKQKNMQSQAAGVSPGPVTPDQAKLVEGAYPGSTTQVPGESIPAQGPTQEGQPPISAQDYQAPATTMFRGDPATQKQTLVAKKLEEMSQTPEWATMSPDQKMLKVMQSGITAQELGPYERILASGITANEKGEQVPYYSIDRQGKPVQMGTVPKNSVFRQEPAPQAPQPETTFSWTTKDEKGSDVTHFGIHPRGSKAIQELQGPGGVANLHQGNQPAPRAGGSAKTPGLYDEKVLNQYRSAVKSPNGAAAALSARAQFIASITDPSLKSDFAQAHQDSVTKKQKFSDMVKRITPPDGTPDQQKAYMDKVNEIAGELVAQ